MTFQTAMLTICRTKPAIPQRFSKSMSTRSNASRIDNELYSHASIQPTAISPPLPVPRSLPSNLLAILNSCPISDFTTLGREHHPHHPQFTHRHFLVHAEDTCRIAVTPSRIAIAIATVPPNENEPHMYLYQSLSTSIQIFPPNTTVEQPRPHTPFHLPIPHQRDYVEIIHA